MEVAGWHTCPPVLKLLWFALPVFPVCTIRVKTQRDQSWSQADGRPPCVNCDNAIQWEPSQNPNPLTDYNKTLHNWLRPRDEHVFQNLCKSTVRERLGKYVKYKALSFLFWCIFSRTRLLKWPVGAFSRMMAQITHSHARKCLFRGQHGGRQHLGGQIS